MKSFLALERPATFTCRKNGKERIYIVHEGEEFVNYQLISESDTDKENGVIAQLTLNGWNERDSFEAKAKSKLAYYDTVAIVIDDSPISNEIYRNELFQWAKLSKDKLMHLCLKDVYYPIDWDALNINPVYLPVALRFGLSDGIIPTPSRESYITNEHTKNLIIDRIKQVAEWFVQRYNKENPFVYDNLLQAYEQIGNSKYELLIEGKSFSVNTIMSWSTTKINELKIKGLSLLKPEFLKAAFRELFFEWEEVGYKSNHGYYRKAAKRIPVSKFVLSGRKPVLVSAVPLGNLKSFLVSKYSDQQGGEILFVLKARTRRLGTRKDNQMHCCYRSTLLLINHKRDEYREIIKEWQSVRDSLASNFIDETNVATSEEFATWLQKRREDLKAMRIAGDYKGLNKKQGDVTIAYANLNRRSIMGFKKEVFRINSLEKNRYLTVLVTEGDDIKEVKGIMMMMRESKKVKFALVGKKEIKKIPNHHQFITFKKFIMSAKPFARLASALLFAPVVEDFEEITNYREGIFQNCLSPYFNDLQLLKKYIENNYKEVGEDEIKDYILEAAEENNLFDKQYWDIYLRLKEAIKKYDFITCLQEPSTWDNSTRVKYKRIIGQLLLFRKKYYNDLPEGVEIEIKLPKLAEEQQEEEEKEEVGSDTF